MEVIVEFDYTAEETDELTIKKGDIIRDVSQFEEGWYIGTLNGKIGVFPDNFVKVLNSVETVKEPKPTGNEGGSAKPEEDGESGVKPQGVQGIGLGNIFSGQPIQLKQTALKDVMKDAESPQDKAPGTAKPESPTSPGTNDRVRVRFDYEPKQPDELELHVDDIIQVLDRSLPDDGWWKGRNLRTNKVGVFPDNFVIPYNDTNKENTVESSTNKTSATASGKPVPVTTVTLQNGAAPNPVSNNRVSSPSTTTGPKAVSAVKTNEPPKVASKPVSNPSSTKSGVNVLGNSGSHRDPKASVPNSSGRVENKQITSNLTEGQKNADRTSHWKHTPDRSEQTERSILILDERRSGEGTDVSDANNHRLTVLTTERPRQTGRRLPSRFSRSTTPNSEASVDLHYESESVHKDTHTSNTHTPRLQSSLPNRHTPHLQDDTRSGTDIAERRAADLSARAHRAPQNSQARSGPLPRSEGGSGSADLARSPELGSTKAGISEATRQSLAKLQTQYDSLKTQHTQHITECMQQSREMRQQLEQLKESNKKLRLEVSNGQRVLTERLQTLMNELDESKKQRAADAVELARLRSLLMQLDAKTLLATDQKVINLSRQRHQHQAGDRIDDRLQETDDNDADSIYEEEDGPAQYNPMIGDNGRGGLIHKNGDMNNSIPHPVTITKTPIAPPLRPRPTHPASYSRG